jgi:hypothetical protein
MAFKENKTGDAEWVHRLKNNPVLFIGTIIILIIVIIAFVLVPAIVPEYGAASGVDLTFGSYDQKPITYVPGNYFARRYVEMSQYWQQVMEPYQFMLYGRWMWQAAFESAAVQTAVLREMELSGYTIPPELVDRKVAMMPEFQENGRFSAALYQRLSSNDRLSLWRQQQDELIVERFQSDISGLLKSSGEVSFISGMASPQRSFEMVSFSVDAYPDSELVRYMAEHADLFRAVHLSKITVNSSEREARQILDSIRDGTTTFEDAAKSQSQDEYADRNGDMGIKLAHELSLEIPVETDREQIITLAPGEYSGIIKSGSGWAFFRAEEGVQPADIADSATLGKVRSYVQTFERGRMEDWAIAQARDFISLVNAAGFDRAASQRELEKRSFGPLPLNYGGVDLFAALSSFSAPELSNPYGAGGADTNENFWKTAFGAAVNVPSEPFVQGGNVLVLFPAAETAADESSVAAIASTYESEAWSSGMTNQSIYAYFLASKKMNNQFDATYARYIQPQSE